MRDYIELDQHFIKLRFKIEYGVTRFFFDFGNYLEDFMIAGTTFPDEYKIANCSPENIQNLRTWHILF